jgi:hypothetical protein
VQKANGSAEIVNPAVDYVFEVYDRFGRPIVVDLGIDAPRVVDEIDRLNDVISRALETLMNTSGDGDRIDAAIEILEENTR